MQQDSQPGEDDDSGHVEIPVIIKKNQILQAHKSDTGAVFQEWMRCLKKRQFKFYLPLFLKAKIKSNMFFFKDMSKGHWSMNI